MLYLLKSYDFSKVKSCHATSDGMTKQYYHANKSGVTWVFTFETPSNVTDVVTTMHMVRLCYFVVPAGLARLKSLDLQNIFRCGYY
jgi:hypothetical protein